MQNAKVALIFLGVIIVALAIGLYYVYDKSQKEIAQVRGDLNDSKLEVGALNTQLKTRKEELRVKEETETQLKSQLEQAAQAKKTLDEELSKATNELAASAAKLQQSSQTVATLNNEKSALQGTVQNLNTKVADLDKKIAKLEDELERGEKNRELLLKELASLRLDKANLEKKFNDINEVRSQYRNLRHDEILETRRRWIAQGYNGFYTKTGNYETPKPYVSRAPAYDLKAEIYSRGTNATPYSVSDKPAK
jgi:chromosome segregation ATPase